MVKLDIPDFQLESSRWLEAIIVKNLKNRYIRNRFSNFDIVWHVDASVASGFYRPLKFLQFLL